MDYGSNQTAVISDAPDVLKGYKDANYEGFHILTG
jgi:hypothetical protein